MHPAERGSALLDVSPVNRGSTVSPVGGGSAAVHGRSGGRSFEGPLELTGE